MNVGIVGHEAAKFTRVNEALARMIIRVLIAEPGTVVVSGGCHLGGVDAWAEEEALAMERGTLIFRPARLSWEGGYKERNLLIAKHSEIVHCLVVRTLPESYTGMRFPYCYHCRTDAHVKSGGCWTARRCAKHQIHVIG